MTTETNDETQQPTNPILTPDQKAVLAVQEEHRFLVNLRDRNDGKDSTPALVDDISALEVVMGSESAMIAYATEKAKRQNAGSTEIRASQIVPTLEIA